MTYRSTISAGLFIFLAGCATMPPANTPDGLFQQAEKLYSGKNYEEAIVRLKKVRDVTTAPDLIAQAELKIADAEFANKNYIEAAAAYESFRKLHPGHEEIPFVLYRLGLCHYNQITGIDTEQTPVNNASAMFETFLRQYPSSRYAADVRTKLDDCREKQLRYFIYVGSFYCRWGKYQASVKRLEEALVQFPKSRLHDETFFYLGKAYLRLGDSAKGKEALNRLFNEFPSSKFVPDARKLLKKG